MLPSTSVVFTVCFMQLNIWWFGCIRGELC